MFDEKNFTQENYDKAFLQKQNYIKTTFAEFNIPELEVFASDYINYRQRAEFRIWHKQEDIFHIMFDATSNQSKAQIVRTDSFPPASKPINKAMLAIIPLIKTNDILRNRLFQIEYLSSTTGELLISLIYHKKLDDAWLEEAKILAEKLNAKIVGRSRKQKIVVNDDFVLEKMQIADKQIILKQIENSFTQPNGKVAESMLNWIYTKTQAIKDQLKNTDLLELYSGNSFFSLALTESFSKILNAEISKTSTAAAEYNIRENDCKNLIALNAKSEDIAFLLSASHNAKNSISLENAKKSDDLKNLENLENLESLEDLENLENTEPRAIEVLQEQTQADFNKQNEKEKKAMALELAKKAVNLADYNFSSLLVDPPRKGLDDLTLKEAQKFDYVFYISCNPETLKQNLLELTKTHKIESMAFFDQFPYTHHAELGLVLKKA